VIARMVGFADVLISAERVALNLLQRLSGIATLTNKYVKAVEGTGAQIADTRATTPGLRCSSDTRSNSAADTTAGSVWTTAWS
jgi:nicotinate-nucleotide pyrophosphorylase (carboxylating)